jgi:hypothetical protein
MSIKCPLAVGQIYPYVSACHAIISEGKYFDIILKGIFGEKRCRLQKRRPPRAFD